MRCERNAFGRQVRSFEGDVAIEGFEEPVPRRLHPRALGGRSTATAVSVLGSVDGHPVAVAAGRITAVAFHPELTGDDRLHRWLLEQL